jgi:sec-independent protein translocase protein TatC
MPSLPRLPFIKKKKKKDAPEPTEVRMTIFEHLGELRRRLMISVAGIVVGAIIVYIFFVPLLHLMSEPYQQLKHRKLIATGVADQFIVRLQVSGYGGFVLAFPIVLWQVWRFVTPGLNPKEKKYAVPFVLSSIVLFVLGGVVGWLTLRPALGFLLGAGGNQVVSAITASSYVKLVALIIVAFGLSFEFPIILVFLLLARVINTRQLRNRRRIAFVGILIFAAVITPSQDPYSLFLMAIPMYIFYEAAIIIGRILKR